MKCPHCNKVIDNDSKFCEYCGSEVKKITEDKTVKTKIKVLDVSLALWFLSYLFIIKYMPHFFSLITYYILPIYLVLTCMFFYLKFKGNLCKNVNRMLYLSFALLALNIYFIVIQLDHLKVVMSY